MGWTGYAQLRGDLLWYAVGVSLVLVVVLVLQISSACARSSKGRWGWVAVTSTPSFERRLRKQRPASIVVAPSTKNSMMVVNPVVAARWQQAGAAARGPGAAGRPVRIDLVASRVMDELPTTTTPPPTTTTVRTDCDPFSMNDSCEVCSGLFKCWPCCSPRLVQEHARALTQRRKEERHDHHIACCIFRRSY